VLDKKYFRIIFAYTINISHDNMSTKRVLKNLGERLAEKRREKGLNMKQFCDKYKLAPIQYWRVEHGKSNVTMKSLGRLCAIHKCTVGQLLEGL
jgi:DNA-binding Xre family transcriptional regulator